MPALSAIGLNCLITNGTGVDRVAASTQCLYSGPTLSSAPTMTTTRPARRTSRKSASAVAKPAAIAPATPAVPSAVQTVARQLRSLADTVLGIAGPATDIALALASSQVKDPKKKVAIAKVGQQLRQVRESAGLTVSELASAINLGDATLIEQAEEGRAALPFELILRVAGVLGRGDPVTFVMRMTRAYNPSLWHALEDLGVGHLLVQAGRERELANVYRASDAARVLNDADFAAVLEFTRSAFDTAVKFRADARKR